MCYVVIRMNTHPQIYGDSLCSILGMFHPELRLRHHENSYQERVNWDVLFVE